MGAWTLSVPRPLHPSRRSSSSTTTWTSTSGSSSRSTDAVIVENTGAKGPFRCTEHRSGVGDAAIVAFLDDDAEAAPDWLERLAALYDDPDVLAVGGRVVPAGKPTGPATSPKSWTGSSAARHRGHAQGRRRGPQCHRREHVFPCRGFAGGRRFQHRPWPAGRAAAGLRGDGALHPGGHRLAGTRVVYEPAALVHHYVPAQRGTLSYMLRRAWSEGISKAQVSRIVGHKRALGPERRYVRQVLPRAVFAGIAGRARGTDPAGLRRAAAIIAVLAVNHLRVRPAAAACPCPHVRGHRAARVPTRAGGKSNDPRCHPQGNFAPNHRTAGGARSMSQSERDV